MENSGKTKSVFPMGIFFISFDPMRGFIEIWHTHERFCRQPYIILMPKYFILNTVYALTLCTLRERLCARVENLRMGPLSRNPKILTNQFIEILTTSVGSAQYYILYCNNYYCYSQCCDASNVVLSVHNRFTLM